jgi:hypothetical protein
MIILDYLLPLLFDSGLIVIQLKFDPRRLDNQQSIRKLKNERIHFSVKYIDLLINRAFIFNLNRFEK